MKSTRHVLAWAVFLAILSVSAGSVGFGLGALSDVATRALPTLAVEVFKPQLGVGVSSEGTRVAESVNRLVVTSTPSPTATLTPTAIPPTPTPAAKTPLPVTLAPPVVPAFATDYEVIADCRGYAFVNDGITVGDGATSARFLTGIFLDPKWGCAPDEDAVDCMLRERNPRLVIVALGKNPDPDFGVNLPRIIAKLHGRSYLLIGRHTINEEADAYINAIMAEKGHFIDYKAEAISRGLVVYSGGQKVYDAILNPNWDGFHYSDCGLQLLQDLVFHTGTPACTPYGQ